MKGRGSDGGCSSWTEGASVEGARGTEPDGYGEEGDGLTLALVQFQNQTRLDSHTGSDIRDKDQGPYA